VRISARLAAFVGVYALAVSQSCSDDTGPHRDLQVSDSAGVRVVRNLVPPRDTLRLESADLRIGGIDVEPEYTFQSIHDLTVLPDSTIVVADLGGRVAQFSSTGQWLRDIGRAGQGPGEYGQPILVQARGDTLALWDARPPRLSLFDASGEFLRVVPIEKTAPSLPVRWLEDDAVVDEREWGQAYDPRPAQAAVVRVRGRQVIDTLEGPYPVPEFEWRIVDEKSQTGVMVMPPVFSVRPQWELCSDYLYWVDPSEPRVRRLTLDGVLSAVIEIPSRSRPITEDERTEYFEALADRFALDEEQLESARGETRFQSRSPEITDIVCGAGGQVWIADFAAGVAEPIDAVGNDWDVIGGDGRAVARVHFPEGFLLKAVTSYAAYGYAARQLGVQVVEVHYLPAGLLAASAARQRAR
jgi:hypothetical protein